ncbi:MAG: class I SAM-dependent methyltransferase [Ignavibacteriaceae bacterium]
MENYFTRHYAEINGINPDSEESIKNWFNKQLDNTDYKLLNNQNLFNAKSILELGCGIGGLMYFLIHNGHGNIKGLDISNEQLDICRKYVSHNVICDNASNYLKNCSVKYDLIILFDLIEHIKKEKILEFIKDMSDSLNENGTIILRTPNMGSLFALKSRYIDFTHEIGFTRESLSQVFNESGFSDVKVTNAYIGRKRLFVIGIFQKVLEKLYNVKFSEIVTPNIMLIAKKMPG